MKSTFIQLIGILTLISCSEEPDQWEIMEKIKTHFLAIDLAGIELEYTRVSYNPYQSFDYRNPDSLFTYNSIQLLDDSFYSERKATFPGGFEFELNEFQKDSTSIFYDVNGVLYGNRAIKQPSRLESIQEEVDGVLDFRHSQGLFSNYDSFAISTFDRKANTIAIIGKKGDDSVRLTFQIAPVQLKIAEHFKSNEKWIFSDHRLGDFNHSTKIKFFVDGQHKRDYLVQSIRAIESIDTSKFELPERVTLYESPPTKPTIQKVENGLFVLKSLPGDRNVMFSIDKSVVTVFGAPISDQISKLVIELIKEHFPESSIKYVYVTHFHSDHIGGLKAYSDLGVTVLADEYTMEAIRSYPRFKENVDSFIFQSINQKMELNDFRFYQVDNSHSLTQSFVYFKKSGIIYQGDFLEIPADNSLPNYLPEATLQFYDFIIDEKLVVRRIVGHHRNDSISMELFHEYVANFLTKDSM